MSTEKKWRWIHGLHGLTSGIACGLFLQHWFFTMWGETTTGVRLATLLLIIAGLFAGSRLLYERRDTVTSSSRS